MQISLISIFMDTTKFNGSVSSHVSTSVINQTDYERLHEYFIKTLIPNNVGYTMLIINRQYDASRYDYNYPMIQSPFLLSSLFSTTRSLRRKRQSRVLILLQKLKSCPISTKYINCDKFIGWLIKFNNQYLITKNIINPRSCGIRYKA